MPVTRTNGIQVPVNSDAFDPTGDMTRLADSANVIIPVLNQTARDALTKKNGLAVARLDLPGCPIQMCDGTNWAQQQIAKVWANNPHVGSSSGLLANLQSGAYVPIMQGGTVVCTTDANGFSNFAFPQAFPSGLMFWVGMNADDVATGTGVFISQGSANSTLTTAFFHARNATSNANYASQSIRLDWFAMGW